SDLFSLGAVLYEMVTGRGPFAGSSTALIFDAILNREPAPACEVNPGLPVEVERIINKAVEKDLELRYQSAAELRSDLKRLKRDSESGKAAAAPPMRAKGGGQRLAWWGLGVLCLAALIAGVLVYRRQKAAVPTSSQWQQLTFFTDSAVYPALSPDGRMLAFIRGGDPFLSTGEIYLKLLPDGEPVQLTHDGRVKLSPVFSPDGSRIAYGTVDPWDTWVVPVLGGEPHLLLPNSSSLTWIENGNRLLFSEIKEGLHMAVVTSDQARGHSRDVYLPPGDRSMAHHSYLSPDGRWVLVVEMNRQGELLPCRVVPFEGGAAREVGPADGACLAGAWSSDGNWVYVNSHAGGRYHIWRQRFPDGRPEQLTSGPTEEEGIEMAADGKSLLSSVGSDDTTVWVHDERGDRQISSEGNAGGARFSADGRLLYFLMEVGQGPAELWKTDLASGQSERVLPGYAMEQYSVSRDGKWIAFVQQDATRHAHVWVAATNHRSSPQQLTHGGEEDSVHFLPNNDLVFRGQEGPSNFVYRMKLDGTEQGKLTPTKVLDLVEVSPSGSWVVATARRSDEEHPYAVMALPVESGDPVTICRALCRPRWDAENKLVYLEFAQQGDINYALPVAPGSDLPRVPAGGLTGSADALQVKGALAVRHSVAAVLNSSVYAFVRATTRRNIYRIPLP
ncbi:MAG TPA: hypothetical protein VLC12_00535, partial [Terriglobales bacterium]|nr:hypothetical protein [Terriglobales bacterium]